MRSLRILALSLSMALPLSAFALPPALESLQKQGGVVGQSFPGPDGLTGWVVTISGRSLVVYTTPSGNYALSGALVDKGGNNLTQQYSDTYIQQPAANKLAGQLRTDQLLVDEGDPHAPELYAYADANCIFCNKFWTELRPYLQSGKVRVRWVLVAFLKDSSAGRAAAILAAKDGVAALAQDETKFDKAKEEGGIPPLDPVPDELRAELLLHSSQMAGVGGQGTPLILYHLADGWHMSQGLPPDMAKFIGGLSAGNPGAR